MPHALLLLWIFIPWTAQAGDDLEALMRTQMDGMVKEQYALTQNALQAEFTQAQQRIRALEQEKNQSSARAAAQAETDQKGLALLRDFDRLLVSRYVNKKGSFDPGQEIGIKEIENLNDLFKAYLSVTPLSDRVSAGQARKTVAWAIDRLEDLASAHASPSESNNSDFEILGKRIRDEEARIEKLNRQAEAIGFALDSSAAPLVVPSPSPAPARALGSRKKKGR